MRAGASAGAFGRAREQASERASGVVPACALARARARAGRLCVHVRARASALAVMTDPTTARGAAAAAVVHGSGISASKSNVARSSNSRIFARSERTCAVQPNGYPPTKRLSVG